MSLTGDLVPAAPAGPIAFTGCDMQSAAAERGAPAQGHDHAHPRRREVVVNGKRIKTIDVHAHCCVPKAMALIKHPLEAPGAFMLHLQVDDVDAWWKRAIGAGAEVLLPVQEMFWGDRYGQLRDPFGVRWSIGAHKR